MTRGSTGRRVVSEAARGKRDPVFVAIKRHRAARAAFDRAMVDKCANSALKAISEEERDGLIQLLRTEPSTVAGCAALVAHLDDLAIEVEDLPSDWLAVLFGTLRASLSRLALQAS
jgi:hypothetical protein